MKNFYLHKRFSSILFLGVYLFLFTIGILHHHDLYNINGTIICNPGEDHVHHKDPFSTNDSFCLLAHLSNTLSNVNYYPNNLSVILNEIAKVSVCEHTTLSQVQFTVISLRAPPAKA